MIQRREERAAIDAKGAEREERRCATPIFGLKSASCELAQRTASCQCSQHSLDRKGPGIRGTRIQLTCPMRLYYCLYLSRLFVGFLLISRLASLFLLAARADHHRPRGNSHM